MEKKGLIIVDANLYKWLYVYETKSLYIGPINPEEFAEISRHPCESPHQEHRHDWSAFRCWRAATASTTSQ